MNVPGREETEAQPLLEVTPFERRTWRVQRIGWVAMGLVILLALAGVLGAGPVTRSTARAADGSLAVRYHTVVRWMTTTVFEWDAAAHPGDSVVTVELPAGFRDVLQVERISPPPLRTELGDSVERLVFPSTASNPLPIKVELRPLQPGRYTLRTRAATGSWTRFRLVVLP